MVLQERLTKKDKKRKERLPISEEKGEGGSRKKKPKGSSPLLNIIYLLLLNKKGLGGFLNS